MTQAFFIAWVSKLPDGARGIPADRRARVRRIAIAPRPQPDWRARRPRGRRSDRRVVRHRLAGRSRAVGERRADAVAFATPRAGSTEGSARCRICQAGGARHEREPLRNPQNRNGASRSPAHRSVSVARRAVGASRLAHGRLPCHRSRRRPFTGQSRHRCSSGGHPRPLAAVSSAMRAWGQVPVHAPETDRAVDAPLHQGRQLTDGDDARAMAVDAEPSWDDPAAHHGRHGADDGSAPSDSRPRNARACARRHRQGHRRRRLDGY